MFEDSVKDWIINLDTDALRWTENEWKENLKGTTLKRMKPWMWKRNIKAASKKK